VARRIEWVLQDFSLHAAQFRYLGGWFATAADLEEEGEWHTLSDALTWGRARAPVVVMSLWVGSPRRRVTYSAGISSCQRFLEWHEPADPNVARVEHFSGTVQITEEPDERVPRETFSLMTETRSGEGVDTVEGKAGLPLLDALDLARSSSDVVIVGTVRLPDTYDYFNAGSELAPAEVYPPHPLLP